MFDPSATRHRRWLALALGVVALAACQLDASRAEHEHDRLEVPNASHKECTANGQCTVVPGPGPDRCTDGDACGGFRLMCSSGTCDLVPGEGPDLCGALGPAPECVGHHMECGLPGDNEEGTCVLAQGFGPNTCTDYYDCGYSSFGCQQGQCAFIPGGHTPTCTSDGECLGHHLACNGVSCELAPGEGANECLGDTDCATSTVCIDDACVPVRENDDPNGGFRRCNFDADCEGQHMGCAEHRCLLLPGDGENECLRSRECQPTAVVDTCVDGMCVEVPADEAPGGSRCSSDTDCAGNHMECDSEACVIRPNTVGGSNEDQCGVDKDCRDSHLACIDGQCIELSGEGPDACWTDGPCMGKHMACERHDCVLVPGFGPNECLDDRRCQTGSVCQAGACVQMTGVHEHQCTDQADCEGKHTACAGHDSCEVVDGEGSDECSSDGDCNHGTVCFDETCVMVYGLHTVECNGNKDCELPPGGPDGEPIP